MQVLSPAMKRRRRKFYLRSQAAAEIKNSPLREQRLVWYLRKHNINEQVASKVYDALDHLPDVVLQTLDEMICDEMLYEKLDIFTFEPLEEGAE